MRVAQYKGYTVYSNGLIERKHTKGYVKPTKAKNSNHLYFRLTEESKKSKLEYVHRFVWEAFNGAIPDGLVIDHIDEDPTNNRLENLQLLTLAENSSKSQQKFTKAQLDEMRYLRNELGWSLKRIADRFGMKDTSIQHLNKNGFRYIFESTI